MDDKRLDELIEECVAWIREFFEHNGPGCNAVVGISGGKDSSVAAALCVKALGRDRVIGVLMPKGVQPDIDAAYMLVNHLGIKHMEVNIGETADALKNAVAKAFTQTDMSGCAGANTDKDGSVTLSEQSQVNMSPRLRMTTLYAVSQSLNGRVVNTCNLSEDWVGYSTRYGDAAGDFAPLCSLTVQEIKAIGRKLGLPTELTEKVPIDGLCGKTDEDNLGFTYAVLDRYIRTGEIDDEETKKIIDKKHAANLFKLRYMDCFESGIPVKA